jgi:hypothetical protein
MMIMSGCIGRKKLWHGDRLGRRDLAAAACCELCASGQVQRRSFQRGAARTATRCTKQDIPHVHSLCCQIGQLGGLGRDDTGIAASEQLMFR